MYIDVMFTNNTIPGVCLYCPSKTPASTFYTSFRPKTSCMMSLKYPKISPNAVKIHVKDTRALIPARAESIHLTRVFHECTFSLL